MKNKEEPSAHSRRRNPSRQVDLYRSWGDGHEPTGSPSRRGANVVARAEQPALSEDHSVVRDCSSSSNRVVRTRTLRGVGRAVSNGGPYPIPRLLASWLVKKWSDNVITIANTRMPKILQHSTETR